MDALLLCGIIILILVLLILVYSVSTYSLLDRKLSRLETLFREAAETQARANQLMGQGETKDKNT